jgi:hypothetical protein
LDETMTLHHDPLLAASIELCRLKGFQVIPPGGEEWGYREAGRKRRLRRPWRGECLKTLREQGGRVRRTLAACSLSSNLVYGERKTEPWFDQAMRMACGKVPFNEKEWSAALQIAAWMEASIDEPDEVGDSELLRKTYRALPERPAQAQKAPAASLPAQPATAPEPPSEPAEEPAGSSEGPRRLDPALVKQGIGYALGVRKLRAEMDERRRRNWERNAWFFRERPPPASQAASS